MQLVHRCFECNLPFILVPVFDTSVRFTSGFVLLASSATDVESAFRSVIDWRCTRWVWHIEVDLDRYFKWFDLCASTAATTLHRLPMFALILVRTHT
jgi:hypothetical protein